MTLQSAMGVSVLVPLLSSSLLMHRSTSAVLRSSSIFVLLIVLAGFIPATAQSSLSHTTSTADSTASTGQETVPSDVRIPFWDDVETAVEDHGGDYVGTRDGRSDLYEQESLVYRDPPPLRYNRVEGLVVGVRRSPLGLASGDRARIVGQLAYATALNDVRYTVGLESQLHATETAGLKIGAMYQEQTLSPNRWQTSYLENSLAALGFEHDFFDYYEAEGLSLYAVQEFPHSLRLKGGIRVEDHRSLPVQTRWSVFEGGGFRSNPAIDEGRLQALFAELTGGSIRDRSDLPTGSAFRVATTVADGLGGDFAFSRFEADGRLFFPLTRDTRLGLRMRGGYATGRAPRQAQFTIGGIGSLRSYDQNAFRGTRALLGNAEYIIDGATVFDNLLDDLFLVAFADAGWVGGPQDRLRFDDVLPAAGVGIGLDERKIRFDVSWPLRDVPGRGSSPAIWLRITPNF